MLIRNIPFYRRTLSAGNVSITISTMFYILLCIFLIMMIINIGLVSISLKFVRLFYYGHIVFVEQSYLLNADKVKLHLVGDMVPTVWRKIGHRLSYCFNSIKLCILSISGV